MGGLLLIYRNIILELLVEPYVFYVLTTWKLNRPPHFRLKALGALCAVLDRVFFSATPKFRYKAAAAVVSARRGGASAAFDRLNKYFALAEMPIVTSQYWNSVHGMQPEQVCQDIEGLQTMRTLGLDMAWMLKAIAQKKEAEGMPEKETMIQTNFIR